MKKTYYSLLAALVLGSIACGRAFDTPASASTITMTVHNFWGHGMLATSDANITEGQLVFICETKPRMYSNGLLEVDHYVAVEPCPSIPID